MKHQSANFWNVGYREGLQELDVRGELDELESTMRTGPWFSMKRRTKNEPRLKLQPSCHGRRLTINNEI